MEAFQEFPHSPPPHRGHTKPLPPVPWSRKSMRRQSHTKAKSHLRPRPLGSLPRSKSLIRPALKERLVRIFRTVYLVLITLTALALAGFVLYSVLFAEKHARETCCQVRKICARVRLQNSSTKSNSSHYYQRLELTGSYNSMQGVAVIYNDTIRINKAGLYLVQSVIFYDGSSTQLDSQNNIHHNLYVMRDQSIETITVISQRSNSTFYGNVSYIHTIRNLNNTDQIYVTFSDWISSDLFSCLELTLLQ